MLRFFAALFALLAMFSNAHSQGFNENYEILIGDSNFDGQQDLFIHQKPRLIILHGEIAVPIVIPAPVPPILLLNIGNGSFDMTSSLTTSEIDQYSQWPVSGIEISLRDIDLDGAMDLETGYLSTVIEGAYDHVIFAGQNIGDDPLQISPMDEKFNAYFSDLFRWIQDPDYFDEYAPRRVVGYEPPSRIYMGSIFDASDIATLVFALGHCDTTHHDLDCGLSTDDPSDCWQYLELYNENGESLGWDWVNVCVEAEIHVYAYEPGSVTIELDYSVFDGDAIDTSDILQRLNENCGALPTSSDFSDMDGIFSRVFGDGRILNVLRPLVDTPNSINHHPFPGDSLFDVNDHTYHHYDVVTKVCSFGEPGCDVETLTNAVLRNFSYPSYKLTPHLTSVDGSSVLVRVTWPGQWDEPENYTIPGGTITQQFLQEAPYVGGIQNITEWTHIVYPGTISRVINEHADGLYSFTHGIGVNRAFCSIDSDWRPLNMILGYANDAGGAKAFKTLDKQMIKYYQGINP